ncbi:TPA: hypothetical protein RI770_003669, partial [Vibrio cholerae]|nr:hypothetical protein [Vibrio cholerae]
VLQQLPADYVGTKESLKKYESCCNLFELMLVINAALKDKILDNNNVFFKSIKELVNFPENIVQSFTARRTIEQFVRDFHLSNALMVLEEKQQIVQQNQVPVKSKTLRDGWNEFYASKEFFSVIATSIAAGVTGTLALFWAYLHTL